MKRPLILATIITLAISTVILVGQSLAQQENRTYSGPEFGNDPPKKVFSLLEALVA